MLPPDFVFKGEPNQDVHEEVESFCDAETATFSVQKNAWFSEDVMMEWIDTCWKYIVTGPSILILDILKVHKCYRVRLALAEMGTSVYYVPPECTGVAQPLDVGVMALLKAHLKQHPSSLLTHGGHVTARKRRRDMFERSLAAMESITCETVVNSFRKSGPFLPFGPEFRHHAVFYGLQEAVV
jgi:hypothetical protein